MRLKLTLARPNGSREDIVVTTDAAATIAEVASKVARADPAQPLPPEGDYTLQAALPGHTEWLPLPPDGPVGEAWIGSGATVHISDAGKYFSQAKTGHAPTIATLTILSGPDVGRTIPLSVGSYTVGRDASCDLALDDKLVSKKHVRLEVGDGVDVIDLGSANGVEVDGGLVSRLRVTDSDTIQLGDTQLKITLSESVVHSGVAPKAGPIFFNRSPRVEKRYLGQEFAGPEVPAEPDDQPFPFLAMLAPALMGFGLFAVTQRLTSLIFVALSPIMIIGNFVMQKQRDKRKLKKQIKKFEARLEALNLEMEKERPTERELRLGESPSTQEAYEQAMRRGPVLWTRRPEHWSFLNVRLGVGTMTSRNTISSGARGDMLPEFQERLDAVIEENRTIDGVPLIDNLYDSGALGIAGSPHSAAGSVNSVLVQITALHSPAEVVVAALVTPDWSQELAWLKWLPHTSSPHSPIDAIHLADSASSAGHLLSALEELIHSRLSANRSSRVRRGAMTQGAAALERGAEVGKDSISSGTKSQIPAVIVLITDDVAVDRARLVQLAELGADAGVYPIWIARDVASLPAVCRTFLSVPDDGTKATAGFVRLGEYIDDVETELIDADTALDYGKRMAPLIDAGALVEDSSDLPRSVSLVTLLGHDLVESSEAVIDRWRQNSSIHDRTPGAPHKPRRAGKLRAIVGSGGVDAMHLDLRTQGPHALVGGTTGAGKSEFLQAWVLGMAAEYSPDRVTFLFVDYKGGSAFADCVSLPHTVGLVTDLSPHLVRRALTSLRAELHFREHLLNRKKAKDLLELEKRGDPDSPPALILVIDEFAALVGEVPEFVDGVVDIAQRGRSLGIHLIMATQRPAGVIKDNLRANTNLRVALRMADESDSQDVVGIQDAAHFDPAIPGRGVAKTGPGRLMKFQSGYAGGWTTKEIDRPDIDVAELKFGGETRWEEPNSTQTEEKDLGPTDQQRLVASLITAASSAGIPAPRRPWLDEIASIYDLGLLRQRSDTDLLLGVSDLPDIQQQKPVYFQPDVDGHIAIFGTGGSGKSAALRTIAGAAGITPRGGPVQVYGLDFGAGSLRMLNDLPHVGAVISGDDTERIVRLFRRLNSELEARGPRYAEASAANITDYRRLANRPDEPRILLVIDGYPAFRNEWEVPAGRSIWYDVFKSILTDGRQLGMHVAFTADRPGAVPGSIGSNIQRRVVLRLSDESGYSLLDAPSDVLSATSPPGRAIVDGFETQIAIIGGSAQMSDQAAATRRLAASMGRAGVVETPPIGSLPKEYAQSDLPAALDGKPVLGISEAELGPYGIDPAGSMLLAGGPATGRTNSLFAIIDAFRHFDPETRFYYIGNARSAVSSGREWVEAATTIESIAALAKNLSAAVADPETEGRIAVFIEAIGDFLQTPADAAIVELTKAVKRSDHFILAEAETSSWNSSWPLMSEFKNARRGLLLQPDMIEGDLILKTPLPRIAKSEFPPGRGMYIARGKFARVQLPLVDPT
ncbi:FtsK/SpoIIIE domain-containing protein [Mycetocola zhujimingii]|uniref:FtsK/SpoIIIE domain-containing protein n=1 Tax=Mycetocola zhujimingii TaxID=2079792 RepID=UPI000D3CA51C|nr:FtsK/SpoIIIE domain-containing protein [Mycetocola zhujimingii]AWB87218.1 phosphopeptide-binding protein [Mycetocola zhujimingii]